MNICKQRSNMTVFSSMTLRKERLLPPPSPKVMTRGFKRPASCTLQSRVPPLLLSPTSLPFFECGIFCGVDSLLSYFSRFLPSWGFCSPPSIFLLPVYLLPTLEFVSGSRPITPPPPPPTGHTHNNFFYASCFRSANLLQLHVH